MVHPAAKQLADVQHQQATDMERGAILGRCALLCWGGVGDVLAFVFMDLPAVVCLEFAFSLFFVFVLFRRLPCVSRVCLLS